ncbi:uncharacterized protein (DUF427 family) [Rubricella aquisinus]|uniref:Uncharacterized protein (DUF427 family) n=1 Tax=Rubricella aquisinus TaxID=2028108 RepID=A0A840WVR6_9RHOB|nr:DUF427 domain-containing protein [Rubricella aquisinus]MBB5514344.1 uncharacterized protein (DUF427 family) [Rubricella aquisinus]
MTELTPENVQCYPRPPQLERVDLPLTIHFAGKEIARTDSGFRVLETHHAPTYYLPQAHFLPGCLRPAKGQSLCEWKGEARYFDIVLGTSEAAGAAWCYPTPTAPFAALRGHIAVYAEPMDACFVGDVQVTPQPGNFYGGWVTPNLIGTVKGAPGTNHW